MSNNCIAKIKVNKFYMVFAGPPHPAFVYEIDKKHKTIKSIKFGTTKAKHMTEIHSLQDNTDIKQYEHNRPFEGTIKDYGDKELVGLSINELDFEVIEEIKKESQIDLEGLNSDINKKPSNPCELYDGRLT